MIILPENQVMTTSPDVDGGKKIKKRKLDEGLFSVEGALFVNRSAGLWDGSLFRTSLRTKNYFAFSKLCISFIPELGKIIDA